MMKQKTFKINESIMTVKKEEKWLITLSKPEK